MRIRSKSYPAFLILGFLVLAPSAHAVCSTTETTVWGVVSDDRDRNVSGLSAQICMTASFNNGVSTREICKSLATDAYGQFRFQQQFVYCDINMPFDSNDVHVIAYEATLKSATLPVEISGEVDFWAPVEKRFTWHSVVPNFIVFSQNANLFFHVPARIECKTSPDDCGLVFDPLEVLKTERGLKAQAINDHEKAGPRADSGAGAAAGSAPGASGGAR